VFSPEEVWALVRAAASEQDEAIFLMAAFTGPRMGELLAPRWRDVDFAGRTIRVRASYYAGQLTTPKSGRGRAVPMAPDVATALAEVGRREHWVGDDELVFAGHLGGHLDGSALRFGTLGLTAGLATDQKSRLAIGLASDVGGHRPLPWVARGWRALLHLRSRP
jgi:integrase